MLTLKSIAVATIVTIILILFFLRGIVYEYYKEKKEEKIKKSITDKIKKLDWNSISWEVTTEENKKIITKIIIREKLYNQIKKILNSCSCSYKIEQYVYVGHPYYDAGIRKQSTEYSEFFDETGSFLLLSKTKIEKGKYFLKVNLNISFEKSHININKEFII